MKLPFGFRVTRTERNPTEVVVCIAVDTRVAERQFEAALRRIQAVQARR